MSERLDLAAWVGRRQVREDQVSAARLAAWNATLDLDVPPPREGDAVPPGFHWTLCPPVARPSELGPDGTERRGGFLPPVELPRRMWAGSRLELGEGLRVGDRVERVSTVERVEEKRGRSGPLVFVTLRHILSGPRGTAVDEAQELVYRDPPAEAGSQKPAAPVAARRGAVRREIAPDDLLLFRYSALTFNGHRIHYDRRYATAEEGYPGLVVHGPLIATLLLDLLRRERPSASVARFRFAARRPTFDGSPFTVEGEPGDGEHHFRLWSTDNRGELGIEAEAWTRSAWPS